MQEEKKDLEQKEEIIEAEVSGGVVEEDRGIIKSEQHLEQMEYVANNIDRFVDAQKKIWVGILKLAKPGDWVTFNKEIAELGFAGTNRIRSALGISFSNWTMQKVTGKDKYGEYYRYEYESDCTFRKITIRVFNRCSSRDKLFGKKHGVFKQIEEVDECNVMMAARRGVIKEGVKTQLGIHHIPLGELEKAGIQVVEGKGYTFTDSGAEPQQKKQYTGAEKATTKQVEYIHTLLKKKGLTEEQLSNYLSFQYKIESSKDILFKDVNDILKWIETGNAGGGK